MADEFAPGDVVMLKSGGPVMTAGKSGDYNGEQKVFCEWFDDKQVRQTGTFPPYMLKKVRSRPDGSGC